MKRFCQNGFTLVELLVVIVIIGVMAMLIAPTFGAGSDVVRVKTASRGVMQLSRYARTMAVLHQTPVELVFSSDGAVRVEQVGGSGTGLVSMKAFSSTNAVDDAAEALAASTASPGAEMDETSGASGGGSAYVMADLNIEKKYEQVRFVFEGYTDSVDTGRRVAGRVVEAVSDERETAGGGDEVETSRVRYRSNGVCRPYRVRVEAEGNPSCAMTVVVDLLGAAKIEGDEP